LYWFCWYFKNGPTLAYNTTATPKDYVSYQLSVSGLTGGHSGVKIVNGGSNAIKLLGDFLSKQTDLRLAAISGGSFPNVIADSASTTVSLPSTQKENFEKDWNTLLKSRRNTLPQIQIWLVKLNQLPLHPKV
jgi:di/tripeptidase